MTTAVPVTDSLCLFGHFGSYHSFRHELKHGLETQFSATCLTIINADVIRMLYCSPLKLDTSFR